VSRRRRTTQELRAVLIQREKERREGLTPGDPGDRWLAAAEAGQEYRPRSNSWRDRPCTHAQTSALRRLGLNPATYPNRGAASDAISKAKARGKR
jgi:hypothetical protein